MSGELVTIQFDEAKLKQLQQMLGGFPRGFPRVVSRALNRAAMTFRSKVTHSVRAETGISLKAIKREVTQWPRANPTQLWTNVRIKRRGFSLIEMKPKQTKVGVVTTRGKRETFPHAFIADIRGHGYPGVYIRTSKARFPVRHLRTKDVVTIVKEAGHWDSHYSGIMSDLERRLMAETEFLLKGGSWKQVDSRLGQSWAEWRSEMGAFEFR